MKFTLSWLKDHIKTNASLEQIAQTLTMIGLEVEQIMDPSEALKPFTVAKILHAEQHPQADKLRVCKVQSDAGELQIVCGAPNARAGIFVALAKEGAVIPGNGMVIKKTKIRGVESCGMLCSADELALGTDSDGIIELPEAPIGAPLADVLGMTDPLIDVNVTPNRADCLSIRGIARDLAAAGLGVLNPLPDIPEPGAKNAPSPISVSIQDTKKAPQFIGCHIKGVKNGPSPDWLKKRLESIGEKSISTLVDITNIITFEFGRPLHVFDVAKLKGNITVRDAQAGEKLKALNGKEYSLSPGMTVIADDAKALAIAGIIGGEESGCTETTTDIFLEVALFNPANIAATGRTLQIDSEARYRFERGVDPAFVEMGAKLAVLMITQLCGGTPSPFVHAGKAPEWKREIALHKTRMATLGGVNVEPNTAELILKVLGFACTPAGEGWKVLPPSWRADVEGEADLVEEVLRINGYDNIPISSMPKLTTISKPAIDTMQKRAQVAKRLLATRHYLETCTWSFMPEARAKQFGGNNPKLKLLNPISADLDTMRPSLLPNLLEAAKNNHFRGAKDIYLAEVGLQFADITPQGQRMVAAGISSGTSPWFEHGKASLKEHVCPASAFDAKADALALLQALGQSKCDITTNVPAWYHPGRSGALTLGGKIILGYFGELHPAIAQSYDLEGPVAVFEIFLDAIPTPRAKGKSRGSLKASSFQAVERDFAFLVDDKVTAAEIEKALRKADQNLITNVSLFDVYTGKGVDAGKKSIAVRVTLQAADRTLSEQDITTVSLAVINAAKTFGGALRQ